ncbi:MAG: hypothetical protein NTX59_02975 [Elusimicrobia bacterium]|nr:hypothetical protein [Elusimicrobiota bacterium]
MPLKLFRNSFFAFALLSLPVSLSAVTHTVAVMPFENVSKDPALDWLSLGIPETVTNSLLAVKDLALVERIQVRKVMDEQKLQLTGAIDEKTAVKAGKLMGASVLVVGAFQKHAETVRLTARFVDVESGGILQTAQATGKLNDIFDLQDQIVKGLAENLNIDLKKEELAKLGVRPTESLEAYQHFGQSALLEARKDLQGAVKELREATKLDPKFSLAKNRFIDIFLSMNKGNYWTSDNTTQSAIINTHEVNTSRAGGQDNFNGTPAFTYINEVEGSVAIGKGKPTDAKTKLYSYYVKKADGIYYLGNKSVTSLGGGKEYISTSIYDPPQLFYPYDLEVGKQWVSIATMTTVASSGLNSVTILDGTNQVISTETVTVPAGTFDCYVLKSESTSKVKFSGRVNLKSSTKTVTISWFAQGIGIIKSRLEAEVGTTVGTTVGTAVVSTETALRDYHIEE